MSGVLEKGGEQLSAGRRQLVEAELAFLTRVSKTGAPQDAEVVRDAALRRWRAGSDGHALNKIRDTHLSPGADQVSEPEPVSIGESLGAPGRSVKLAPARTLTGEG